MNTSHEAAAANVISQLAAHGLMLRGVIHFDESDNRPRISNTKFAKSLVLIGHAGKSVWQHFSAWSSLQSPALEHPLDTWSKAAIIPIASQFGGHAVFPSDRPYQPFQQWAMEAEGLKPSPLGLLIHPVFGTWHAYRGAILFDELTQSQFLKELSQPIEKLSHPCDTCVSKPCLSVCPVSAFSEAGFAVDDCRDYLDSTEGQSCMTQGCAARGACPVGTQYKYEREQLQFHMRAFANAQR